MAKRKYSRDYIIKKKMHDYLWLDSLERKLIGLIDYDVSEPPRSDYEAKIYRQRAALMEILDTHQISYDPHSWQLPQRLLVETALRMKAAV